MTFTTLQYNGVEMCLADWQIATALREVSNQAHDHMAFEWMQAADANDPIPYGGQIILRILRTPKSGSGVSPLTGLPLSGITSWTGGQTFFVGWRVENFRTGSPALEKMDLKFAGPWEFFFERLVFQKLWFTWNGAANVADWRSQIILGQSVNALVGPADTIPGTNATSLMSIRQQVAEIIAYVVAQTTTDYGSAQIQSDVLASDENGNFILNATYPGATFPGGSNLLIPDYIAGTYAEEGQVTAGQPQEGSTLANLKTVLRAPLDSVNDITCAEAMRRQIKWIGPMGEAVIWFDYTTTLEGNPCPTLHVGTRDQLPAISLPMVGQNASFKIKRRDDLIPGCVGLKFRVSGTFDNTQYVQVINDIAGTISGTVTEGIGLTGALYTLGTFAGGSPALLGSGTITALENASRDFAAVTSTINFEGNSNTLARCQIYTLPVNITDPSTDSGASLAFWQKLSPELLTLANTPSFASGTSVTVTVDNPNNQNTNQPNDGTAVNLDTYQYLLHDSQLAPWMLSGNTPGGAGALYVQAVINVKWNIIDTTAGITGFSLKKKPYQEKTYRATLVSIPGGLYEVQTSFTPGEVLPYGLAGYIYGIAQIPQYEGTFTLQETEITDQCPLGNNLNISGGRTEWTNMAACVQKITYDLMAGKTTLTFGPAGGLGPKDLVDRLRTNRFPIRPYYGNGGNMTNAANAQAGAQLGNSVAQRGPSPGAENANFVVHPISVTDIASNAAAYLTATSGVGAPGVTIDNTASQPGYGGITAVSVPVVFVASGSGGTVTAFVRIAADGTLIIQDKAASPTQKILIRLADLPAGSGGSPVVAQFQQFSFYQCVESTITPYSAYFLMTTPVAS